MNISIIVPAYNVEKYVGLSIQSLLNQTFQDLEIICVNDGSTDSTQDVLDGYAQKDERIHVISQDNKGVSAARNTGLKAATGELVMFLDGDDTLEADACEKIAAVYAKHNPDVITFSGICTPTFYGNYWIQSHIQTDDELIDSFTTDLLTKKGAAPFMRMACRNDFLKEHEIEFEETLKLGEDEVFCFDIYPLSKRTVLMKDQLYRYRMSREGSAVQASQKSLRAKLQEHYKVLDVIIAHWKKFDLLEGYQDFLMSFFCEYALLETLRLPSKDFAACQQAFKEVILKGWSEDKIAELARANKWAHLLKSSLFKRVSLPERRKLSSKVYCDLYGARTFPMDVASRAKLRILNSVKQH